jgi:ABC-type multidrug transport system ATPase subunit
VHSRFRGEVIYQAETEIHFPQMSVGDTLRFAALARTPENRLPGVSRQLYAEHLTDVIMAMLGLSHTVNTKVGDDLVRGVSGGERKRVSIAEVLLSRSPMQCWDNSTRGLDSATALEFVRTLKLATDLGRTATVVAIYQASQAAYDVSKPVNQDHSFQVLMSLAHCRNLTKSPCYTMEGKFTLALQHPPKSISLTWATFAQTDRRPRISSHL